MADEGKKQDEEKKRAKRKPAKKKAAEAKKEPKKTEQKTRTKAPGKKEARKIAAEKPADPFETIKFVLMTEKCVRMIESQNKLVFVVRRQARKVQIRKAVESAFQSPVSSVTTAIDQKGRKRAFVKFGQAGAAGDIAVRLGII